MTVRGVRSAAGSAPPGGGAAAGGAGGGGGEGRGGSRSPGLSAVSSSVFTFRFRRRVLGEEGVADQEDEDADGNGRVGHVEGRPEPDVDKIGDLAQAQAVDEVAGGAAKHHTDGYGRDDMVERRGAGGEGEGGGAGDRGGGGKTGAGLV